MDSKIFTIGCEKELDTFWYYFEKEHCCFDAMGICYHIMSEYLYNNKYKSVDIVYVKDKEKASFTIKSEELLEVFKKHIRHLKPDLEVRISNKEIKLIDKSPYSSQKIFLDEDKKLKNSPYERASCQECEFYDFSSDTQELLEDEASLHSKVSSYAYRHEINIDSYEIQMLGSDLKESIMILRDMLQTLDDMGVQQGVVKHISRELSMFSRRVGELLEFELISTSIESIAQKLDKLSIEQACAKRIRIFIESVVDDLESWMINILEGNTVDIHYLDHSINSSAQQLDSLLEMKFA